MPCRIRPPDRIPGDAGVEVEVVLISYRACLQEPSGRRIVDPGLVVVELQVRQHDQAGGLEAAARPAAGLAPGPVPVEVAGRDSPGAVGPGRRRALVVVDQPAPADRAGRGARPVS